MSNKERLDVLLVERNLFESRERAKRIIMTGKVLVDDKKIDKASGIENDPNLWCSEHNDEKYILNLILSTLTVSLKTLDIVDSLPNVDFSYNKISF